MEEPENLGGAEIVSLETVPYDEPFTFDILPASDSGTYFVGDALVASTLHDGVNWTVALAPDALHALLNAGGMPPDLANLVPAVADADICTPNAS